MHRDWRDKLADLPRLEDPERIWRRIEQGPTGDSVPSAPARGQRVVAAVVAIVVFAGAAVFTFDALREDRTPLEDLPPSEGALVATLDAPDDGSIPFMELRYESESASIHAQGGEWPGGPDAWTAELQAAPAELPLGTPIAFVGDASAVDATIRYGLTGEVPTGLLDDVLPEVPGAYVVEVLGTWPRGTAAFTFSVVVRDPDAVTVTWDETGDDAPWVHARYLDADVELITTPGVGNTVGITEVGTIPELTIPAGTDVWVSGEATSLDAAIGTGREVSSFDEVPSSLPAVVTRDLQPGRHIVRVDLETQQGPSISLLTLHVEEPAASSEPPALGAVVTIQREPLRVTLTYDGREERAIIDDTSKPSGDPFADAHPPCELSLLAYDMLLVIPPSTPFTVESQPRLDGWTVFPQPDSDPTRVPRTPGPVEWTFRGGWDDLDFDACFGLFVGEPDTPVVIPDVVGMVDQRAYGSVADAGLRWDVRLEDAPEEPQWRVLRTEPASGTSLRPNDVVTLVIATTITPLPDGADDALTCGSDDHVPVAGPHFFLLPSGEAFVRANLGGLQEGDEIVDAEGPGSGDDGLWQVVRDGRVIAVVSYDGLDGVACRGSGIAGA